VVAILVLTIKAYFIFSLISSPADWLLKTVLFVKTHEISGENRQKTRLVHFLLKTYSYVNNPTRRSAMRDMLRHL
jgi:hypothetical protein